MRVAERSEPPDPRVAAKLTVDTRWGGIPLSVDESGRVALK